MNYLIMPHLRHSLVSAVDTVPQESHWKQPYLADRKLQRCDSSGYPVSEAGRYDENIPMRHAIGVPMRNLFLLGP